MKKQQPQILGGVIFLLIILVLLYIYYFHPDTWAQMTQYSGPGGPFINNP